MNTFKNIYIYGFHYIRKSSPEYSKSGGIRYMNINLFKKKIDDLCKKYDLLTLDEFKNLSKLKTKKKKFLLSFDDSLIDHFKILDILKEKKLWGIFFIPTKPYLEKKFIPTFALHYLISYSGLRNVAIKVFEIIGQSNFDKRDFDYEEFGKIKKKSKTRYLKKIINSLIFFKNDNAKDIFIKKLIKEVKPDLKISDIHMSIKNIKELSKNGMLIGSHGITHNYMSDLNSKQQFNEIKKSFEFFKKIDIRFYPKTFAYPYGKFHTFNIQTINVLKKNNVKYGFIYNEKREVKNFKNSKDLIINRINPDEKNY